MTILGFLLLPIVLILWVQLTERAKRSEKERKDMELKYGIISDD